MNAPTTTQITRIKAEDFEFSIYKKRTPGTGRRSCSTRIWLMKRFFDTGRLLKGRITAIDVKQLADVPESEKLARCEELLANAKQRTTAHETPERAAQ